MKFSEVWLREWVNPTVNTEMLAEQLTMAGLEVDSIEPAAGKFTGVVIGRVVECHQHPNADKLRVTKVDIGKEELLDIVCGAANCRQGLVVACATVGAVLPGNFKIKEAKLRGELSQGMLCSYSELGIEDDHEGIIELPQDAPIGKDIRDYLKLDDTIIEISVTPNRADCLSIVGVARDIAAVNQLPFSMPTQSQIKASISDTFPVHIETPSDCPRYLGRIVKGINLQVETPLWMKEKLRRGGIRSIDPVVDITNYVLLELGQPMHAFDLAKLSGGIIVRKAKQDEEVTLLDGNVIKLQNDVLVVADEQKVLALAAIFGGLYSGINSNTQDVFLQCAYFNPLAIVNRARRFGLRTDASHRHERGVDPEISYRAMTRTTELLLEICGGSAGPVIDCTAEQDLPQHKPVILTRNKLDRLIGYPIDSKKVETILCNLGCQVTEQGNDWIVSTPSWRFDLQIEEDLIEEVVRIFGYNNIPDVPISAQLVISDHKENNLSINRVKMLLVDRGFQEAITYSFVDPKIQSLLHPSQQALLLPNPISSEMSAMRLSMLTGLLNTVVYNQNRQQNRIRLFETGLRYIPDPQADLGIRQEHILSAVITGKRYDERWNTSDEPVDFYDLKGDLEAVLELTGRIGQYDFRAYNHPACHPGQCAGIYIDNDYIGFIGVIHPELERKLDLNSNTVVFEIQWDKINCQEIPQAVDIPRFPANRRDIAIIVADDIVAADIIKECKKVGGNQLVGVNLFDVYRGKGIADGHKSLAISLVLQDNTRTLEEEEIATTVAKCVAALQQRFQASLRD